LIFTETELRGAWIVEAEPYVDERGYFARTWCQREFEEHGLNPLLVQCSVSFNRSKGTWRGMHFQKPPFAETKLVRCTRGSILDVIADLRPDSPTYGRHLTVPLSATGGRSLYVPEAFAHGFLSLEDNTEVFYQISEFHSPASAGGFRWDDPCFSIRLPAPITMISEQDKSWPDFRKESRP